MSFASTYTHNTTEHVGPPEITGPLPVLRSNLHTQHNRARRPACNHGSASRPSLQLTHTTQQGTSARLQPRVRFPSFAPTYTHNTTGQVGPPSTTGPLLVYRSNSHIQHNRARRPACPHGSASRPSLKLTHTTQQGTSSRLQPRVRFPSFAPTYTHNTTGHVGPPSTTGPFPVLRSNLHSSATVMAAS